LRAGRWNLRFHRWWRLSVKLRFTCRPPIRCADWWR
jgi:hypothetical protein